MEEKPLDLAEHEHEPVISVWKRRAMFFVMIGLCVAFAAPIGYGSCSGAFGSGGTEVWATFRVAGKERTVREDEFRRTFENLDRVESFLSGGQRRRELDDDQAWDHILLDELAKAEGVHVSDAQIRDFLGRLRDFQTAGSFDESKYRSFVGEMSSRGLDHETLTTTLRSILRRLAYERVFHGAAMLASSPEAYESWKKENRRVSVDWIARPYAEGAKELDAKPVTEQDLRAVAAVPEVLQMRKVAARRSFEAAVVRVRDLTDAHRTAMTEFVTTAGLLPRGNTVATVAWQHYWTNRGSGDAFSRDNWLRVRRKEYEKAREAHEKAKKERDAKPEAERGPEPVPPVDPASEPWPEEEIEVYRKFFESRVVGEVLGREVLKHLAGRAERETKPFAALLPDYEKLGVRLVVTAAPVADDEIVAKFPEDLAKDSEVEQVILGVFPLPAAASAGKEFEPKVHPDPVPTTRLSDRLDDRGFLVLRWTGLEPARERDVLEVREKAEEYVRRQRRTERARDVLAEVRTKVDPAEGGSEAKSQAFRKEAAAAGLGEVRTIRRFHARTARSTPPADGPGAVLARQRNRVLDKYSLLSRTDPGKFLDPIALDDGTQAAYLVLVTEHHEPTPVEMDENTLRAEQDKLRRRNLMRLLSEVVGGKALRERCKFEFTKVYQERMKGRAAPDHQ